MTNSASLYIAQVRFCRALAVVRCLPTESGGVFQPSIADRLNLYGLYKQTIAGDCMLLKPSSRNIVQYAKWKAWDRLRGISPIDAQTLYSDALVELLTEFIERHPDSELTTSLTESLDYLQEIQEIKADQEENLVQWDTNNEQEKEYYLGQIRSEQLFSEPQTAFYSSPSEFPMTPELSPRHYQKSPQEEQDYDNEVATATSSLYLSSPGRHPYSNRTRKYKKVLTSMALKSLQLEVGALCQEIDHMRRNNHRISFLRWRGLWLLKSVARHTFFNFLILLLVFIVLWRRKSPIAYAIKSYTGPRTKDQIRYLFRHGVFWKVTA